MDHKVYLEYQAFYQLYLNILLILFQVHGKVILELVKKKIQVLSTDFFQLSS